MLDLLVLGVPVLDLPVIGSPLVDLPVAAGADVAGLPVAVALLRAVGVAGAALLVGAGVRHAVAPASVRALLRAHGIVPHAAVPPIATLLGPVEIALGALVLLGGVAGATLGSAPVVGLPRRRPPRSTCSSPPTCSACWPPDLVVRAGASAVTSR